MTKLLPFSASLLTLSLVVSGLVLPPPAAADDDLGPLKAEVESVRQRHFIQDVRHATLPRTELRSFLEKQLQKDLPMPLNEYLGTLRALHLIDKEDGIDPMLDLYEAQVLAFYDPVSHVFYSLDKPPEAAGALPEAMQKAIVVHELTHALQDQLFEAGAKMQKVQDDWDAQLAYQSVLEGEATMVMMAYLGQTLGMTLDEMVATPDLLKTLVAASSANSGVPESTPRFFVESLKFPYIAGVAFAIDAYKRKGWDALDEIDRCPPTSSAEIIDPARYWAGHSSSGGTSNEGSGTALGVFHWEFLLGEGAAAGWVGDRVDVLHRADPTPTVLVESRWDSAEHAHDFIRRYEAFLRQNKERPSSTVKGTTARIAYGADRRAVDRFVRKKSEVLAMPQPRQCSSVIAVGTSNSQ